MVNKFQSMGFTFHMELKGKARNRKQMKGNKGKQRQGSRFCCGGFRCRKPSKIPKVPVEATCAELHSHFGSLRGTLRQSNIAPAGKWTIEINDVPM